MKELMYNEFGSTMENKIPITVINAIHTTEVLAQTQLNQMEVKQMTKISEEALNYKPQTKTKNIADLQQVSVDLDLIDDSFDFDGKTVNQKVIVVDNEKYRVPTTVIQQLKVILEDNPKMTKFKVKKSGTTKEDTKYLVIPLI